MTDNEIVKILEYCTTDGWCSNCPHYKKCIEDEITQLALDLINRQKAEIERLEKGCGIITEEDENWYPPPLKTSEEIKAEAVKEIVRKLKEKADANEIWIGGKAYTFYTIQEDKLDNLVKERVS